MRGTHPHDEYTEHDLHSYVNRRYEQWVRTHGTVNPSMTLYIHPSWQSRLRTDVACTDDHIFYLTYHGIPVKTSLHTGRQPYRLVMRRNP